MSRAQAQNQPSVEELLVSIRQAIHGDGKSPLQQTKPLAVSQPAKKVANGAPVSGSMNQTRVSLQAGAGKNTGVTRQHTENFFKLRNQLHELGAKAPHASDSPAAPERQGGPANGFASILSGDMRLEEALEKLKRAGLGDDTPEDNTQGHDELRAGHFDQVEPEYDTREIADTDSAEFEDEYTYEAEGPISPQTRQAYIEPTQPVEQPPQRPPHQSLTPVTPPPLHTPLTSETSAAETSAAFNRLADTIVGHATTGERSIDELTRELLRPMLQSWLDENLPRLVERLVREEIERVARWGGK